MFDLYLRHMRFATAAGVHVIPKHHLALHLWDHAAVTGNPKEFANWYDEHLNATLAAVAKAVTLQCTSGECFRTFCWHTALSVGDARLMGQPKPASHHYGRERHWHMVVITSQ